MVGGVTVLLGRENERKQSYSQQDRAVIFTAGQSSHIHSRTEQSYGQQDRRPEHRLIDEYRVSWRHMLYHRVGKHVGGRCHVN